MTHRKIKILDCTLRDGGRILDCKFDDSVIAGMNRDFVNAGIDIVEVGFLRGGSLVEYKGNSTFFTSAGQIEGFIPGNRQDTIFAAFIDYGMYDFDDLAPCDGKSVTALRVGFTHKDYVNDKDGICKVLNVVKEKGYRLFVQNVNTPGYSDRELLEVVELVNEIQPYCYGIVDTYGSMYLEDMVHYYNLIDYNLRSNCAIDIHSHNNFQSSFAFAQQIIQMSSGRRNIILDATLNGMGKCAGNLNTELVADYLVRKKGSDYDVDLILDMIDRYLAEYREAATWGYSIPAFMAGIYRAHPNNVIYLTQKFRLNSKDIKYILSGIDEEKRQRYDYDNIQRVYKEYNDHRIDDSQSIEKLKRIFEGRTVLLLAPGSSVNEELDSIRNYINENSPLVVGINFMHKVLKADYYFFANTIHWERCEPLLEHGRCIITSNVKEQTGGAYLVNYSSLIEEDSFLYDNSTIMCLNLMKKMNVQRIALAGFDGLKEKGDNYVDGSFLNQNNMYTIKQLNEEVRRLYQNFKIKAEEKLSVDILTASLYEKLS